MTLWYVGVLALVVIAFAAMTNFVLVNALNKDTDERLVEMARNFGVALMAEQEDEKSSAASERAIAEAVNEMRFRDYQFLISTHEGRVFASTIEAALDAKCLDHTTDFRTCEINGESFRVYESPLTSGTTEYRLLSFHSLKEQLALKLQVTVMYLCNPSRDR